MTITYGNGATTSYTWQLDGDLTGLTHSLANETVAFSYTYNARGQRTGKSVNNNLYLWKPGASSSTGYTANGLNQYASVEAVSYSYDANGNLTDDGVLSYGYDTESHLTSVTGPGVSASYAYDALGRRRSQTVGGTTTEYLYDGARVIAAFDATGNRLRRFVYGPGLDEPLALIGSGGTIHYYHQDALGSVIALSDSTGNVAERYAYGPFGQTATVSLLGNPYRYTGRRYDEATGLYHYRARAYSEPLGRFLQPDPIGYGDGMNLYAYVSNDPLNLIDPWGLAGDRYHQASGAYALTRPTDPGLQPVAILPVVVALQTGLDLYHNIRVNGLRLKSIVWAAVGVFTRGVGKALGSVARGTPRALPTPKLHGKTSPIKERGTFYVDSKGNVIPTPPGGRITGSPDGRFIQARDAAGNPTGVRIDGPHRPATHSDPRAQQPHGHVPGVTNPDGTPWLPIN